MIDIERVNEVYSAFSLTLQYYIVFRRASDEAR